MTDINTLIQLREKSDQEMMESMLPFGFHDDGIPDDNIIDYAPSDPFDTQDYVTRGNFDNY